MRLPSERGQLSAGVFRALRSAAEISPTLVPAAETAVGEGVGVLRDDDLQITLWALYELHYRGFDGVDTDREWDPDLIRLRRRIEATIEAALRSATSTIVSAVADHGEFADQLLEFIDSAEGPSPAVFLHRHATRDQVVGFLRERSVYHLKESDPHAFVLSRIDGAPKAALAELLYDEYGAGRPAQLHATLYGDALEACGLDRTYGAYIDEVSALTLSVNNVMSLFGLQRRLRGAAMGHLAAFEATSSVPSRKIATGIERVGLPDVVAAYFHEHVEADAVHEQVAARDICGNLVEHDPSLRTDVLFGAASCLHLDALAAAQLLQTWGPEAAA